MNNSLVNASLANLTVHFGGSEANAFSSLVNLCSVEPSVSNKLVKMSYLSFLCDHMTDEMWRGLEISKNMSGSSTGADVENFWRTKSAEIISDLKADLSIQNIDNVYKKYMALFADMRNDFAPFVQRMDVGMSGEVAILDSMKFDFLGDEKGLSQKKEKTATIDEKIGVENVATISEIIEPEKKSKKKNDVEPAKVDTPQVKEKVEPENADNTAKEKDPFDELFDDAKLNDAEDKVAFLHPLTYVVENFVASDTDGNILNDVKITSDEKSKIIDKVKVGDTEYSIGDKSVVQYREDKITAKKELNSLTVAHKTNRDVELASVITSIISTAEYMKKSKQEPFVLNLNLKTEDFAQKVSSALFDLMNNEFFEGKDGKKTSFDFSGVSEFKFNGVSVSKESFATAKNLDDFDKVIFGASFADKDENKKSNEAKDKQFNAGTAKLNSDYLDELPELPPEITPEMMKAFFGGNSK